MKISIRADASATIGAGHVMRCLALAQELRTRGHEVSLLHADQPNHPIPWTGYARQLDVALVPIRPERPGTPMPDGPSLAHAHFLNWDWQADAAEVWRVLERESENLDWLIVDHYALDARWESAVRPLTRNLMVIDDLADREHACDLLLDQNHLGPGNPYAGLLPEHCRILLGPRFALLRPEFEDAAPPRQQRGPIQRLLIFFGGADQKAVARKALEAVRLLSATDLQTDVVLGRAHPAAKEIHTLAERMPHVQIHLQVSDMATLMQHADLMLGAAGTTTWERCAAGLPALILSVAANQETIAKSIAENGLAVYLGRADEVSVEAICRELQDALEHPEAFHQMGQRAAGLVDGRGAQRVAGCLSGETAKEYPGEHSDARPCTT